MKKFSSKLNQFFEFMEFIHEFEEVTRMARPPYRTRFENDAEHSYQLAMMAWFVIDQDKLKLNKELCFMYALVHDLVEVYAGDTNTFDVHHGKSKQARERAAFIKIKKRFSNFKNLTKIIEQYEHKKDPESLFIYALDKILTPMQIYLEKGKLWHEMNVSFDELIENKNHKVALSKDVNKYWQELLSGLEKNKKKFFPKK